MSEKCARHRIPLERVETHDTTAWVCPRCDAEEDRRLESLAVDPGPGGDA